MVGNNYIYFLEMCEAYPVHTMQSVYGFLSKKKKMKNEAVVILSAISKASVSPKDVSFCPLVTVR